MNKYLDIERSVKLVESSENGTTVECKFSVDPELFEYKSKEEIADMIFRAIENAIKR